MLDTELLCVVTVLGGEAASLVVMERRNGVKAQAGELSR